MRIAGRSDRLGLATISGHHVSAVDELRILLILGGFISSVPDKDVQLT